MPHCREKQNLKSNTKCEESVKALLFFVLNFEGYLKIYRLCVYVKYQKKMMLAGSLKTVLQMLRYRITDTV